MSDWMDNVVGRCMACGEPTTRIVLVGCVCEKCAHVQKANITEQYKKGQRAVGWLYNRIHEKNNDE